MPEETGSGVPGAGLLATMPAYSPRLGVLASKLLTVYPANEAQGFPVHQAAIAVFDPATGEMLALVNGDLLTAARTAACSARSIRHLARPGSRVLAVLGNGPQAREHARYACRVHDFADVRVGARDPAKAAALAADLEGEGLPARGTTIDDAIADADVVCAATSTVEPLLRRGHVRPGTHIASVGYIPDGREVDAAILREALVVVEHRETCLQPFPAGSNDLAELVAAGELDPDGVVEIGELVHGRRAGREDEDRVTVFKSVGVAVQDAAAASVVLAAARREGRGVEVSL
ncbi:ornithine cyclodeaminase family protein [Actinomycetospora chibensis]|uniref:Ornithine cyclodeaminase family protein n=1 Tax=Actinomycetospora chibensis TaxID=663606 RepID=A0ABV9RN13_9PSEU|nr:ornithine cyclodeaminase family protein [Actinomycetospora chibensis]MDD7926558.1 ornithine cyclodeaminase family protein [Actinomycetospora chibensis]